MGGDTFTQPYLTTLKPYLTISLVMYDNRFLIILRLLHANLARLLIFDIL